MPINKEIDYAELIRERVKEGIYDKDEIIEMLMKWIGYGNDAEFREMLKLNNLLIYSNE